MSVSEDKVLRELVFQTLEKKGVLGKVQAEIRASVFLALEEQDVFKDKSPFINRKLKDFVNTEDGALVVSLVREFLEFFNLEFTSMVFDPETHAGIDYKYEGRAFLAKELQLNNENEGSKLPLLAQLIYSLKDFKIPCQKESNCSKSENHVPQKVDNDVIHLSKLVEISINGSEINGHNDKLDTKELSISTTSKTSNKIDVITGEEKEFLKPASEKSSLSFLGGLPPLSNSSKTNKPFIIEKDKGVSNDLKELLDFEADEQYKDDFLTELSENSQKDNKNDSVSGESEIDEEISTESNNSPQADEVTTDVSISKASGQGDYEENV